MKTTTTMLERFRFFCQNAGYSIPPGRASCAMTLARAERDGKVRGLRVVWEDEYEVWDGDCEAPKVHAMASIYHPDRAPDARRGDPHFYVLAHLGSIALDSWHDDYMRVVEAELMQEALDVLDGEDEQEALILAARATFAGPCGEGCAS